MPRGSRRVKPGTLAGAEVEIRAEPILGMADDEHAETPLSTRGRTHKPKRCGGALERILRLLAAVTEWLRCARRERDQPARGFRETTAKTR